MIPKFARYNYCIKKSIDFIMEENLISFPFDSDDIISKHHWARLKYSNLSFKLNVSIDEIIEAYGSADGYSTYNGRNYAISYNNTQIPKRIYFTKLHEIGHIYLNHFIDFNETILNRSNLSNAEYKVLENEANCFARNVIAPAVIVKHLNLNTTQKISAYFGITEQAAKTRLDLLNYDYKYISEEDEYKLLNSFGSSIYKRLCLKCNYTFNSKNATYCPICGYHKLTWGDDKMLYYDGYELDDKGRAIECPRCHNEQLAIDGVYCKICGIYLINKCTNANGIYGENAYGNSVEIKPPCGIIADGNARFCEYCGEPTTFYINNLLKDWDSKKTYNELQNESNFPF